MDARCAAPRKPLRGHGRIENTSGTSLPDDIAPVIRDRLARHGMVAAIDAIARGKSP
jgi:hypothetical protein